MAVTRGHLATEDFTELVRAACGSRAVGAAERLRGGTSKGVYRLTLDDATTRIVYVWNAQEDYWPQAGLDPTAAVGVDRFEAAHAALCRLGVRVPEVLYVDRSGQFVAGEVAVVEDVSGGTLEGLWQRDPQRAEPVLGRLADAITAMHRHHRDFCGPPGNATADAREPARVILERALADLKAASAKEVRIAEAADRLTETLSQRFAAVTPRHRYGLIHGELGPDHVLVDDHDRPVLIDIEGSEFFDVEWEHAFLEIRFADRYRHLAVAGLDEDRLGLYRLAMHLSLVAGPLRLLDGDFPDRAAMLNIVAYNVDRTLAQLG